MRRGSDVSPGVQSSSLADISVVLISSNLPHAAAPFPTLLSRCVCVCVLVNVASYHL